MNHLTVTVVLKRVARLLTQWHSCDVPRGYSRDLRERLLQTVASGRPVVEIARITGVSPSSLHRWKRTAAAGASLAPGVSPGGPRKIAGPAEAVVRAQVAARADATLAEHCAQWAAAGQVAVSVATMSRALTRLGLGLKKNADRHRAR